MSISGRRLTDFNPMSSVNVFAIEEAMKMAALDQHRGYTQSHIGEVKQHRDTEYVDHSQAAGYQVIHEPLWNKGTLLCCRCRCRSLSPVRSCVAVVVAASSRPLPPLSSPVSPSHR